MYGRNQAIDLKESKDMKQKLWKAIEQYRCSGGREEHWRNRDALDILIAEALAQQHTPFGYVQYVDKFGDYEFNKRKKDCRNDREAIPVYIAPQAQQVDEYRRGFSDGMKEAPTGECWIRVIDEAMVGAHLGVADIADDYGTAKEKLNDLICWSVEVDRDTAAPAPQAQPVWSNGDEPLVGGGLIRLGKVDSQIREVLETTQAQQPLTDDKTAAQIYEASVRAKSDQCVESASSESYWKKFSQTTDGINIKEEMIEQVEHWHQLACPTPDAKAFNVQLGCHFEEIAEMVRALTFKLGATEARGEGTKLELMLTHVADDLKSGFIDVVVEDRHEFADSIADQIVTATGVGYRAGIDVPRAIEIVNASNWSKFDDNGQPIFDTNGKVSKGPNYRAPDLTECL